MPQKVKIQKTRWTCGCWKQIMKKDCRNFKKHWNQVHVCYYCGLYNGPSIFIDYVDMPKQELVFW